MNITRRSFLKYCIASAAALGLDLTVVGRLKEALADGEIIPPTVIWIDGASCSGCTVAMTNLYGLDDTGAPIDNGPTDVYDFLENYLDVVFAKTIMSDAGDDAVQRLRDAQVGNFVLVVEGGVPTKFGGMTCTLYHDDQTDEEVTMQDAVLNLASQASHVVCVGTCAAYGGFAAADPNPTEVISVGQLLEDTDGIDISTINLINLPGCPAHPDWIVGTIVTALYCDGIQTDEDGRPLMFYGGSTVHDKCPRKILDEKYGDYANDFGQEGRCLLNLGCLGKETYADCPVRGWNNGLNNCIQANGNCIGCVNMDFPRDPLVKRL